MASILIAVLPSHMESTSCTDQHPKKVGFNDQRVILEYSRDVLMAEMGFTNDQFIDFCILLDDFTQFQDNRIGIKTALNLIKKYGRLQDILTNKPKYKFYRVDSQSDKYREQYIYSLRDTAEFNPITKVKTGEVTRFLKSKRYYKEKINESIDLLNGIPRIE